MYAYLSLPHYMTREQLFETWSLLLLQIVKNLIQIISKFTKTIKGTIWQYVCYAMYMLAYLNTH